MSSQIKDLELSLMKKEFVTRVDILIIKKILIGKKERKLIKLLDLHRSKKGEYDCVVPSSGGKDRPMLPTNLNQNMA